MKPKIRPAFHQRSVTPACAVKLLHAGGVSLIKFNLALLLQTAATGTEKLISIWFRHKQMSDIGPNPDQAMVLSRPVTNLIYISVDRFWSIFPAIVTIDSRRCCSR